MEEKVILHNAINTPTKDDIVLQLTDIQLHLSTDITQNPIKRVENAVKYDKEERIYQSLSQSSSVNGIIQTPFFNENDPELKKLVKKYNEQGKRVFILKPKSGLKVKLGSDVEEFINSKKGKRLLRKLNKDVS